MLPLTHSHIQPLGIKELNFITMGTLSCKTGLHHTEWEMKSSEVHGPLSHLIAYVQCHPRVSCDQPCQWQGLSEWSSMSRGNICSSAMMCTLLRELRQFLDCHVQWLPKVQTESWGGHQLSSIYLLPVRISLNHYQKPFLVQIFHYHSDHSRLRQWTIESYLCKIMQ